MSGLLDSPKFARSLSSRRQSPKMLAVETTGDPGAIPPDIYGHTAVLDEGGGGVMIIFGGCNTKGEFLSTLHELNLGCSNYLFVLSRHMSTFNFICFLPVLVFCSLELPLL